MLILANIYCNLNLPRCKHLLHKNLNAALWFFNIVSQQ